jgi:hypothetical protein
MRRSFFWVSSAVCLSLFIALIANLISPSPALKNAGTNLLAFDALPVVNWDADSAVEVGLSVRSSEQAETLSYSSQAEVFRFVLDSEGPYTLRYLTLTVESQGLKPMDKWTVYRVVDGEVDFTKPVAMSERRDGQLLRLRFASSASAGFFADPGKNTFVLVTSVLKDSSSEGGASLTLGFPNAPLDKEWDWAWLPGHHSGAWLEVGESLGLEEVTAG